ncbi:hypothetical protein A9Q84_15935 [Halobacteriovorax marinus]|uniref:Uncharacterized protein n=1 Tax=Halobacteriovorax marinus TaxID=97084 RepID=A0A1Y5F426_9BACT|nr:hypothetical protein A9Q84_15935 [Halobacteriovorax marinus]
MFKLISELLRLKDFEQVKHAIVLKNDTSGTEIMNYKQITIGEIKLTGICLAVPPKSFGANHNLTLYIYKAPLNKETLKKIKNKNFKGSLQLIGKIKEIENEEETQYIEVEFTQFDPQNWKSFYNDYTHAQDTIQDYIEAGEAE